jgi:hypothetical protein
MVLAAMMMKSAPAASSLCAASLKPWPIRSQRPLAGQSRAIVNVEWRSATGALLSYESHDVATAATQVGEATHRSRRCLDDPEHDLDLFGSERDAAPYALEVRTHQ